MTKIILAEGVKGSGKSTYIDNKYKELLNSCTEIEVIDRDDWNTVIYVVEENISKDIIVLNSGSDMKTIIDKFGKLLLKYPQASIIYTAIRPFDTNSHLHCRMKSVLNIQPTNEVTLLPTEEESLIKLYEVLIP